MTRLSLPDPPLDDGVVALRELVESDVSAITAACQDVDIARFTTIPSPYGEGDAREFVARQPRARDEGREVNLAITRSGADELVGTVGLFLVAEGVGELGYWVAPEHRGNGVAHRAVAMMTDWGFATLDLARLQLMTHPENVASQRVAEKAGFSLEGTLRSYREIRGRRADLVMFARLSDDPFAD